MKQLNFAILGAGSIAWTMARTIARMPHVHAYAIGSRTLEKAQAFAAEHGFEKAYGSYVKATFLFPYDKSNLVHILKENAQDVTMEYLEEGTYVTALCGKKEISMFQEYMC